jgi:chemotaxis methyl-accepting protein methylase
MQIESLGVGRRRKETARLYARPTYNSIIIKTTLRFHHRSFLPTLESGSFEENRMNAKRPLAIWSAGCCTGAEPHTLAIVLSAALRYYPAVRFRILAADTSMPVFKTAQVGIYDEREGNPIPIHNKKRSAMRSKDRERLKNRMAPMLRNQVPFRQGNFMSRDFGIRPPMDTVFCRSVIIYFDRPTKPASSAKSAAI